MNRNYFAKVTGRKQVARQGVDSLPLDTGRRSLDWCIGIALLDKHGREQLSDYMRMARDREKNSSQARRVQPGREGSPMPESA
jgi:hypothetical protein